MEAPYGTWSSPIDGHVVADDSGWMYSLVKVSGDDVYWSESRPAEDGRDALVVRRDGAAPADVVPPEFSARTRVHEYGGGAYTVDGDTVYFCNDADQRIYRVDPAGRRSRSRPSRTCRSACATPTCGSPATGSCACASAAAEPEHVNELVAFSADGHVEPR